MNLRYLNKIFLLFFLNYNSKNVIIKLLSSFVLFVNFVYQFNIIKLWKMKKRVVLINIYG